MSVKTVKTFLIIFCIFSLSSCILFSRTNELQKAEEFSRQKKYPEAIASYREHMRQRLKVEDRPEWENPYFYLILIGDIQLGIDKPEDAIISFLEAEEQGVDVYLVSDRIRGVARYYEEKGEIDKALALLLSHRGKDPLLFEAMLDRLNKAKTLLEDQKKSN